MHRLFALPFPSAFSHSSAALSSIFLKNCPLFHLTYSIGLRKDATVGSSYFGLTSPSPSPTVCVGCCVRWYCASQNARHNFSEIYYTKITMIFLLAHLSAPSVSPNSNLRRRISFHLRWYFRFLYSHFSGWSVPGSRFVLKRSTVTATEFALSPKQQLSQYFILFNFPYDNSWIIKEKCLRCTKPPFLQYRKAFRC